MSRLPPPQVVRAPDVPGLQPRYRLGEVVALGEPVNLLRRDTKNGGGFGCASQLTRGGGHRGNLEKFLHMPHEKG